MAAFEHFSSPSCSYYDICSNDDERLIVFGDNYSNIYSHLLFFFDFFSMLLYRW